MDKKSGTAEGPRPERKPEDGKAEEKGEGKHEGPFARILTDEQREKLHELLKAARAEWKEKEDKK